MRSQVIIIIVLYFDLNISKPKIVEYMRANTLVLVSWISAMRAEMDINNVFLDEYTSDINGILSATGRLRTILSDEFNSVHITLRVV
jgi:hypothetical protein